MKLTKPQQAVVEELRQGLFVWTNEGTFFKSWLGDERGNKVKSARLDTVTSLVNKGVLKFVDGDYRKGLYKYELAKEWKS